MLVIRLQRTGRKGHAQFRVVVQDSRRTPSSGRVVALLGAYNPHTKTANIDKDLAAKYLSNGAQPSDRVVRLFQAEGVSMPKWVNVPVSKEGKLRNPDKLRRNRPVEEAAPVEEAPATDEAAEAPADSSAEAPEAESTDSEVVEAEVPAEESEA